MNQKQIKILAGVDGIKSAYADILSENNPIDTICLSQAYDQVIGDYFTKDVAPKLYNGVRTTREILPDNSENREYAKGKPVINQVRFLEPHRPSETDMILSGEIAILVSFNPENPLAVVITEPELVNGYRNYFEALWERIS
jgi:hypothetical protein